MDIRRRMVELYLGIHRYRPALPTLGMRLYETSHIEVKLFMATICTCTMLQYHREYHNRKWIVALDIFIHDILVGMYVPRDKTTGFRNRQQNGTVIL